MSRRIMFVLALPILVALAIAYGQPVSMNAQTVPPPTPRSTVPSPGPARCVVNCIYMPFVTGRLATETLTASSKDLLQ